MSLYDRFRSHASRREAFAFLRYIGPGLLVTVGFIDPGNWASNIAGGRRPRLRPPVGGHPRDAHAHRPPAQRGPPRDRHRALPLGGDDPVYPPHPGPAHPRERGPGLGLHGPGRDPGRGHRPPHALPRPPSPGRGRPGHGVRPGHALHQLLPEAREVDHRLRLAHRPGFPLRARSRPRPLGQGGRRLGPSGIPARLDASSS